MRNTIAGLVAGVVLATAGTGVAMSVGSWHTPQVNCKSGSYGVVCMKNDGSGYGVAVGKNIAMVVNLKTGKRVFLRIQP